MSTDVQPTISQDAMRLLKRVVAGDLLYGTRTYPHPHRFTVAAKKTGVRAIVAAPTVAQLVERQLLEAVPQERGRPEGADAISYRASAAGVTAAKLADKYVHPDSGQLSLLETPAPDPAERKSS
jgi:hypothetical protein